MNAADLIPVILLVLFSVGVIIGAGLVLLVMRLVRRSPTVSRISILDIPAAFSNANTTYIRRPTCWLAVKTKDATAVQKALGLHDPQPCLVSEGLPGEKRLFIAPPVRGWVLASGSGLPDPSDDVDACFRMLLNLSRKLGQVQFFSACRILNNHAWVRMDHGKVIRAYAWAGKTLWNEGQRTRAELELRVDCRDYGDESENGSFTSGNAFNLNVDKVPMLASRWSLDPAALDERFLENERGIMGEPSRHY